MSREVELGWVNWTSFASSCPSCSSTVVQRTLSLWLCPSTAVETAIAQCTSRWAMARGHRLNTSIVLAAVHSLSGPFRAVSAVEPSLCRPLPTLSPSLISHLASVNVKQQWRRKLISSCFAKSPSPSFHWFVQLVFWFRLSLIHFQQVGLTIFYIPSSWLLFYCCSFYGLTRSYRKIWCR